MTRLPLARDDDSVSLASFIDHTLLAPSAPEADYRRLLEEARHWGFAAVCLPPARVPLALAQKDITVCSVVGFPCGYNLSADKVAQAQRLAQMGVHEIDMVMAIGRFKDKNYQSVSDEIRQVKQAAPLLKVIIETALLSDEEITVAAKLCLESGADFVKTSTGFVGGATLQAVRLIQEACGEQIRIKASGGISTCREALTFIEAGASRLGMSKSVQVMREFEELRSA